MITIKIDGTWKLREESLEVKDSDGLKQVSTASDGWIPATVPGDVHLDLMAAGRMEEPLFSTNAPECRWPEQRSWWYRTSIEADPALLRQDKQELVFDGLDYYARVFLNGELLGEAENAFIPHAFDVTHKLREGVNELVVRITAGTERAQNQTVDINKDDPIRGHRDKFKGLVELRKPQYSYGYDWVDALPNIGIWRPVHLRGFSKLRVDDVRTETKLDGDACRLLVTVDIMNLHPWADNDGTLEISLHAPNGECVAEDQQNFLGPVGITRLQSVIAVNEPQLWWPNGLGAQPLYTLRVAVKQGDDTRDTWTREIGLRTVEIARDPLPEGDRFDIRINGQNVFCKGGNWIPPDAIMARADRDKREKLIRHAVEANFTMLRVWGGGVYEADDFYETCDKLGILVWQDFMFACHEYPDQSSTFRDKIRHEAETVIRRLRHHPSIVLWCGNNENLVAMAVWWNKDRLPFPDETLRLGGRHVFSDVLARACLDLDTSLPYWPGSPAGGEDPNGETRGDCHWWHATMGADLVNRHRHEFYDTCRSRFVTEYGIVGPCHLESCRDFLRPEELDVNHRAWKTHTNPYDDGTLAAAIRYHYTEPDGLDIEQLIRYGQMFQAVMHGRTIESMRFRKDDPQDACSGALIWMYNDSWGETGWTPIDYYLRRKPGYYWIRNACAPVRVLVRRRDDQLVSRVVNDRLTPVTVNASFGYVRVDGTDARLQEREVTVPANGMLEIDRAGIPADLNPEEWIYVCDGEGPDVESAPCTWNLVPYRDLIPVAGDISVEIHGTEIKLTSPVYRHGVRHHDAGGDLFSDNYFDLLPGRTKTIRCVGPMPETLCFEALDIAFQ